MNQAELTRLGELVNQRQVLWDYLKATEGEKVARFGERQREALRHVLDHDKSSADELEYQIRQLDKVMDELQARMAHPEGSTHLQSVSRLNRRLQGILDRLGEHSTRALVEPYASDDAPLAEAGDL